MGNEQQVKEISANIEDAKKAIAMADSLDKLTKNPHWKKVIDQGYFKDEPVRLVMLKSQPTFDEKQQKNIDNQIVGVGTLYMFLSHVEALGNEMRIALAEYESAQQEILEEDSE